MAKIIELPEPEDEEDLHRMHSTRMNEIQDDLILADLLGHTVGVNQNVWTRASVARRKSAVDAF